MTLLSLIQIGADAPIQVTHGLFQLFGPHFGRHPSALGYGTVFGGMTPKKPGLERLFGFSFSDLQLTI